MEVGERYVNIGCVAITGGALWDCPMELPDNATRGRSTYRLFSKQIKELL